MIPSSTIQDIIERSPILEIVGKRVKLQRAGREWRGLSPFNQEKTPSFYVSEAKSRFFDFSAGKHGTVIDFVMATEGYSFLEAIDYLAPLAGVTVDRKRATQEQGRRCDLEDILTETQSWFERNLWSGRGTNARLYLSGRGLREEICRGLQLGFAPADRHAAKGHLCGLGFSADAVVASGVVDLHAETGHAYSHLSDRATFPISTRRGRPVAHGGRALEARVEPKYLHSRLTEIFDKSKELFNLHGAAEAIRTAGKSLVMEGYFDVAQAVQAGFHNVVATLGTSLHYAQFLELWKLGPTIAICLDGDAAGRRAAAKIVEASLPLLSGNRRLEFVALPPGHDPDSLIRDLGAEVFQKALSKPVPAVDMVWQAISDQCPGTSPEARAQAEKVARGWCETIGDVTLRGAYLSELVSRARSMGRTYVRSKVSGSVDMSIPAREAAILVAAARFQEAYAAGCVERLGAARWRAPICDRVARGLLDSIAAGTAFSGLEEDLTKLEARLVEPVPGFVGAPNVEAFQGALELHEAETRRRALRGSSALDHRASLQR